MLFSTQPIGGLKSHRNEASSIKGLPLRNFKSVAFEVPPLNGRKSCSGLGTASSAALGAAGAVGAVKGVDAITSQKK